MTDKQLATKTAIQTIKKTIEIIEFAYQLSISLEKKYILPQQICPVMDLRNASNTYTIRRDWTEYKEILCDDFANIVKIGIAGFSIITCKSIYWSLFAKEGHFSEPQHEENPNLYAAQNILKCVRDALGHFKVGTTFNGFGCWDIKKNKYHKPLVFKTESIEVSLDTENLDGTEFLWEQIGGIQNLIKILDFLREDLEKRLQELECFDKLSTSGQK